MSVQAVVTLLVQAGVDLVTRCSHNSLYQVSPLKDTCAAVTHSQSNPTYIKEKTTAVRGTRSSGEQVSAQFVSTAGLVR